MGSRKERGPFGGDGYELFVNPIRRGDVIVRALLAILLLIPLPLFVACKKAATPSTPVTVVQPVTVLVTATDTPTGSPTASFTDTWTFTTTWTPVTILVTATRE